MPEIKEILQEYVATANNPEYKSDFEVINSKFPELSQYDKGLLQEYVATANNPEYKSDFNVINSKFPELFTVKKKETTQVGGQTLKPGTSNISQSNYNLDLKLPSIPVNPNNKALEGLGKPFKPEIALKSAKDEQKFIAAKNPIQTNFTDYSTIINDGIKGQNKFDNTTQTLTSQNVIPQQAKKEVQQLQQKQQVLKDARKDTHQNILAVIPELANAKNTDEAISTILKSDMKNNLDYWQQFDDEALLGNDESTLNDFLVSKGLKNQDREAYLKEQASSNPKYGYEYEYNKIGSLFKAVKQRADDYDVVLKQKFGDNYMDIAKQGNADILNDADFNKFRQLREKQNELSTKANGLINDGKYAEVKKSRDDAERVQSKVDKAAKEDKWYNPDDELNYAANKLGYAAGHVVKMIAELPALATSIDKGYDWTDKLADWGNRFSDNLIESMPVSTDKKTGVFNKVADVDGYKVFVDDNGEPTDVRDKNNFKVPLSVSQSVVEKFSSNPESYKTRNETNLGALADNGLNTMIDMGAMILGTKGAGMLGAGEKLQKLTTMGIAYQQTKRDVYNDAIKKGLDPRNADLLSNIIGVAAGTSSMINPMEFNIAKGAGLFNLLKTDGLNAAKLALIKDGKLSVKDYAKEFVSGAIKNTIGENIEELGIENTTQAISNNHFNNQISETDMVDGGLDDKLHILDKQGLETFLITAGSSFLMTPIEINSQTQFNQQEAMKMAIENPEDFAKIKELQLKQGQISQQQFDNETKIYNDVSKTYNAVKDDVKEELQPQLLALLTKKSNLTNKISEIKDEVLSKPYKDQLEQINKGIESISIGQNASESLVAPIEQSEILAESTAKDGSSTITKTETDIANKINKGEQLTPEETDYYSAQKDSIDKLVTVNKSTIQPINEVTEVKEEIVLPPPPPEIVAPAELDEQQITQQLNEVLNEKTTPTELTDTEQEINNSERLPSELENNQGVQQDNGIGQYVSNESEVPQIEQEQEVGSVGVGGDVKEGSDMWKLTQDESFIKYEDKSTDNYERNGNNTYQRLANNDIKRLQNGESGISIENDKVVFRDENGTPVGYAKFNKDGIKNIGVLPENKGQGIATKMIEYLKKEKGIDTVLPNFSKEGNALAHRNEVKKAIAQGKYEEAIKNGELTQSQVDKIIKSAGLEQSLKEGQPKVETEKPANQKPQDEIKQKKAELGQKLFNIAPKNPIIEEIKSKNLTHVRGKNMGENQSLGTFISTEKGNRYETADNKAEPVEVDIKNPLVVENDLALIGKRTEILNENKNQFTKEDAVDYQELPDGKITLDDLNDAGIKKLAKLTTEKLQADGYDGIYFKESKTQEGELVVFDKNNVKFKNSENNTKSAEDKIIQLTSAHNTTGRQKVEDKESRKSLKKEIEKLAKELGWSIKPRSNAYNFDVIDAKGVQRRPIKDLTAEQKKEQAKRNKEKKETFTKIAQYEFQDIEDKVLQYFGTGGKINSETLKSELLGDGKGGVQQSEWNKKIGMQSGDAPHIDRIIEGLYANAEDTPSDKEQTEARKIIIDVLSKYDTASEMREELLSRMDNADAIDKQVTQEEADAEVLNQKIMERGDYAIFGIEMPDHVAKDLEGIDFLDDKDLESRENDKYEQIYNQYVDKNGNFNEEQFKKDNNESNDIKESDKGAKSENRNEISINTESNRRQAESEHFAETKLLEQKVIDAKKAKQNKLDTLNKKAELFGDVKKENELFGQAQDLSKENIDATMKPYNEAISKAQNDLQKHIDNKDSYIKKYDNQLRADETLQGKELIGDALDRIADKIGSKKNLSQQERTSLKKDVADIGRGLIHLGKATIDNVIEKIKAEIKKRFSNLDDNTVNQIASDALEDIKATNHFNKSDIDEFLDLHKQDTGTIKSLKEEIGEENYNKIVQQFGEKYIKEALGVKEVIETKDEDTKGNKRLLNRAYDGTSDEDLRAAIEKHGLNYEIENQKKAKSDAVEFLDEVGAEKALEALRDDKIKGARASYMWATLIDKISNQIDAETDSKKLKELKELQAQLLSEFDKKKREDGRAISALFDIYKNSDFSYSLAAQELLYKAANNGVIPQDVHRQMVDLERQLKEANSKNQKLEQEREQREAEIAFERLKADQQLSSKKVKTRRGKDLIAEGLDELTSILGVKLSAEGTERPKLVQALSKIGKGFIEEGLATAENVIQKVKEYVKDKFGDKVKFEEIEADLKRSMEQEIKLPTMQDGKLKIPQKLIRNFVESGVRDINELTDKIHEIAVKDYPEITKRQVRDAITDYGKTLTLSQEEIDVALRDIKRTGKLVSALEDVTNKIRPLKSGVQRDKLSQQQRNLQREIKEATKDLPVSQEENDKVWKTALDAVKSRLENQIEDLKKQIAIGEKSPRKKGIKYDDEANALKARRDALKKIIEDIEGKPKMSDEQKIRMAESSLKRAIDEYQRRIDEKDFTPISTKGTTPETPELKELKEKRDDLKKAYQQLYNESDVAEKRKLQLFKNSIQKRTAELQRRINEKDFAKNVRKTVELDEQARQLVKDRNRIKHEFDVLQEKNRIANRSFNEKVKDYALEILNLPKGLLSTLDMSAPLRQGIVLAAGNPKEFGKATKEMFLQAFSGKYADEWLANLKTSPEYDLMQESKLYIADTHAKLQAKEEQFMTNLAQKIPYYGALVRGSERAYTGFLNKLRVDVFAKGVDMLNGQGFNPNDNPEMYKQWAEFINNATGRGNLGSLEKSAEFLNNVFFSPRMLASRLAIMNPAEYASMSPEVRKMAMKSTLSFVGFGLMVLALAGLGGAETEENPLSTDFGKIKVGNTRYDIWGGFLPIIRTIAQVTLGMKKDSRTGEIRELGGNYNRGTILENFFRSKLSPFVGSIVNLLTGKNMIGEKVTPEKELLKSVVPLYIQDIYSLTQQGEVNPLEVASTAIPSFFGVGVQSYEDKNKGTAPQISSVPVNSKPIVSRPIK